MAPCVSAPQESRGTGCNTLLEYSERSKMKPTCGPLPCVMTTFQPWAIISAICTAVSRTAANWSETVLCASSLIREFPPMATTANLLIGVVHFKFLHKEGEHGVEIGALDDFGSWYLVENAVRPMLLTRAKADGWDTGLAHPVGGIGRKYPFAGLCRASIATFKGGLACPHVGMIFWQRPGGKDFFYRKGEARIAWHFIHRQDDLG